MLVQMTSDRLRRPMPLPIPVIIAPIAAEQDQRHRHAAFDDGGDTIVVAVTRINRVARSIRHVSGLRIVGRGITGRRITGRWITGLRIFGRRIIRRAVAIIRRWRNLASSQGQQQDHQRNVTTHLIHPRLVYNLQE
jgi:hypothetical protein